MLFVALLSLSFDMIVAFFVLFVVTELDVEVKVVVEVVVVWVSLVVVIDVVSFDVGTMFGVSKSEMQKHKMLNGKNRDTIAIT